MIDNDISHLTPQFKQKVELFLEDAKSQGFNIVIFEGLRSKERQQELYSYGRPQTPQHPKPITWTLESMHLTGQAVDIVFIVNGKPSWNGDYLGLRKIADKYGITNLGDKEYCHFQDNLQPLTMETPYTGILQEYINNGYVPVLKPDPVKDNRPATIYEVKQIIDIALARSRK